MDHKRGYDYLGSSDHGAPSPTKRRKECPVKQPVWPPQFGERHNAHNRINQYKTQIQNGCPQPGGPPLHAPESPSPAAEPIPSIPTRPVWVGGQKGLDLEKKIEEDLYQSLLPIVKKELEKWAFFSDRAPRKRVSPLCDDPDDEITCAVCRNSRKFQGWDALVIHAKKYSKQMPWQHRGYHRALQEALFEKTSTAAGAEKPKPVQQHPGDQDNAMSELCGNIRHMKVNAPSAWRPDILIVENDELYKMGHILGKQRQQVDPKPQLREIVAVYGHGDQEQQNVFVYPASKAGFVRETGEISSAFRQTSGGRKSNCSWHLEEADSSEVPRVSLPTGSSYDRCESLKEALGLQLTLDDPDDTPGKKLFNVEQIHRTTAVLDRWTENLKSGTKRFETQRVFRDSPELAAIDEGFRADVRRIRTYSPDCKHKIKQQMTEIEGRLRENHIMALQQVDVVRDQFQELADDMQHEEARDKFMAMRADLKKSERMMEQEQEVQHAALREALAKASLVVRRRKEKQQQERVQMMQEWMADAKLFKQESTLAKKERRRLETIHGKAHDQARQFRKDCPVCHESFRTEAQLIKRSV